MLMMMMTTQRRRRRGRAGAGAVVVVVGRGRRVVRRVRRRRGRLDHDRRLDADLVVRRILRRLFADRRQRDVGRDRLQHVKHARDVR